MSPGTERAHFLGLPTAQVRFPYLPGYLAAGTVRSAGPDLLEGHRVALRGVGHQSLAVAPVESVHRLPDDVAFEDAAVWHLALTAMHGLALGGHRDGEPLAVLGAGLLGAITRRLCAARGPSPSVCLAVAASAAKEWTTRTEPGTTFALAEQVGAWSRRFPLVVDVTGTADGLRTATSVVADGGRVVVLGSPRAMLAPFPCGEVYGRGVQVTGAHIRTLADHEEPALTKEFFAMLAEHRFAVRDLLTPWPVDDAHVAYRRLAEDPSFVGAAFHWTARHEYKRECEYESGREYEGGRQRRRARSRTVSHRKKPEPVRFALLGCGDIGIKDAQATVDAEGAQLVACFDPTTELAEDISRRSGCRVAADTDDVLGRADVDAVVIATPHHTHEALAVAALQAGKHVLLEKPLSTDLASAQRIAEAAKTAHSTLSVLFHLRWDERFRRAHALMGDGLVGPPLGVQCAYLVDKRASYFHGGYSGRSLSSWRMSKKLSGGGFLIMNLIHHLDGIRALLGTEADRVYAETVPSRIAPELDDTVSVVVRFGDTVATFVGGSAVVGGAGQQMLVWGEHGRVQLLPEMTYTSLRNSRRPAQDRVSDGGDPRSRAIAGFAAAVREGRAPETTAGDALAAQAIVEAAYESARCGHAVAPASLLPGGDG
ncbi:Gfo/Idh/MocA family oxidoreductase [Streptomyces sp. NPDC053048]|uniref:Gfo/Idh/MocA family oxidoreductase n=1 Tax=Streptomyces sp. NPDC053048 TaxID=3365694 RepID=UPI0037CDDED9